MRIHHLAHHLTISLALFTLAGVSHGADRHHVVTPKPGAAVTVQLIDEGQLSSGVQTRLNLRYSAHPDSVLSVEYRPESGLLMRSPSMVTLRSDSRGQATDAPMVEAVADGTHYLNVFIKQYDGRSRVVSIRLTTGSAARATRKLNDGKNQAPASSGQSGVTSQGEPLVILPADEPRSLRP